MSADRATSTKVAAAQRLYDALKAGDRDALAAVLTPDFVGHATENLPLDMGGEHVGPEAMQRDLWWRIGRNYVASAEPEEMCALDDGRLMVRGRYRGRGRASGNPLDAEFIHLLNFDTSGRISALRQLTDSAAWVHALGDTTEHTPHSTER
ncbi:nuclear transport factor 2 family protein [Mycolicibacterium sp.]|uniref:nuclear transport factor 2 family protein n=1 Tax=Mycolicibacterium sp. TaxID=2320850 RepID=UPI003D13DB83